MLRRAKAGIMALVTDAVSHLGPDSPSWSGDPADLVDFERYPLFEPTGSVMAEVLAGAREQLSQTGAVELGGFVRTQAIELLLADARGLAPLAWKSGGLGRAYLDSSD